MEIVIDRMGLNGAWNKGAWGTVHSTVDGVLCTPGQCMVNCAWCTVDGVFYTENSE